MENKDDFNATSSAKRQADRWPILLVSPEEKLRKWYKKRDPVAIERSNLVNVMRLVMKELIESSVKYGRMLDSDHIPLHHFFILLEHAMRHGLRPKKGLLGPKKELWNVLECVEKYMPEASDITDSVRELPTVKSQLGRARAWLRLALMQKKLADYFRRLIDKKEILSDYYESDALMMCEEAIVIGGLLVGLNVIDCNLCVKEEDLDCEQGVIDFSLYLREQSIEVSEHDGLEENNFTAVLDQKNYIEELNRHLNATVTNLQQKVEHLQTTNALMKEDLAIAKSSARRLEEENSTLRVICDSMTEDSKRRIAEAKADMSTERETYQNTQIGLDSMYNTIKQQLQDEIQKRKEFEVECELQRSLRDEADVAMKLLEKDIHEKQDMIVSMRRQLEDIKLINLQLYEKLKECEGSLKCKSELSTKLEMKVAELTDAIHRLEDKNYDMMRVKNTNEELTRRLGLQIADKEQIKASLESDLKIEREWRTSLQAKIEGLKKNVSDLQHDIETLTLKNLEHEKLKRSHSELQDQYSEQEQALIEIGAQLQDSKLKIEDMKEIQAPSNLQVWICDEDVNQCKHCQKTFSLVTRKHHCRSCGEIFCEKCSDNTMPLPSYARPVRVCDTCYSSLLHRYSANSGVAS